MTTSNTEILERLEEAILTKSKRLMDVPAEIKEAWEKTRIRVRLTRRISVIDVSVPDIILTAGVRRSRDALLGDLLESVLTSALESTATSLLTAAAEVETDTDEEIELERGPV